MVDASSDLEIAPGKTTNPANKNANQIPGPITAAANEGNTNSPEPIIAAKEIMMTPIKFRDLSNWVFTSETTEPISPFSNLLAVDFMSIGIPPDYNS